MEKNEQRLTSLEENGYFMETRLNALDEQVTAQQAQLEALEKNVKQLQTRLGEIRDLLTEARQGSQVEPAPPHHIAKFW